MRLCILALDGVFDTGLTVLLDTFQTANELSALQMEAGPHFDVTVVGTRDTVKTGLGFDVPLCRDGRSQRPEWVIIPALNTKMPEAVVQSLGRPDVIEAKARLRDWHEDGAGLAASCVGTFLLAETGLLDGQEATTTWWLSPLFREHYPAVHLDETRMLVANDRVVTAGAAMGHLDLALFLVQRASPELAAMVARYMLADLRALQSPYIIPGHLAHADPLIQRFERWARGRLSAGFSLQESAQELATSPRTLQRRIQAVLGKSPLGFFQDLRVERAHHLVQTSNLDLDAIAAEVGYADGATLRTLLRRRLGRGVRELRSDLR